MKCDIRIENGNDRIYLTSHQYSVFDYFYMKSDKTLSFFEFVNKFYYRVYVKPKFTNRIRFKLGYPMNYEIEFMEKDIHHVI